MKAQYDIHGVLIEVVSAHFPFFKLFADDLKIFRANGKLHSRRAVRLTLRALSDHKNGVFQSAPLLNYQQIMSNSFLSRDTLLANYGRSLIAVVTHRSKRWIEALVAMDSSLPLDLIYHRCFSQPVSMWLKERGLFFLHAGCVAEDRQGILIVGNSRAGKSTLSISAVRAGFKFLGDEQPILSLKNGGLQVYAFPRRVRLDKPVAKLFPELLPLANSAKSERLLFPIEKIWPGCVLHSCQPRILIFPKFDPRGRMRKKRLHPSAAMARLLKDDYFVWYRMGSWNQLSQRHLILLERLVRETDAFELVYGTEDIPRVPSLFRKLLRNCRETSDTHGAG